MIYLATGCGLAVIQGSDGDCGVRFALQVRKSSVVATDAAREGFVYCGTLGDGLLLSHDGGTTWGHSSLASPNVTALASDDRGILYAGTELSAVHRSDDHGETWRELHTLVTLPSAKYRLLDAEGENRERRDQLIHPPYRKPELLATGTNLAGKLGQFVYENPC